MEFNNSAVACFQTCPQKWAYTYVDKLQPDEAVSTELGFGTAMHCGLQAMLSGEQEYKAIFSSMLGLEMAKDVAYGRWQLADYEAMGATFLDRFERLHLKKLSPKLIEAKMQGTLGPHTIFGTADVIGTFEGKLSVIDFKTSSYPYTVDRLISSPQMYFYAHMASQLGYSVEQLVYIVFVKGKEPRIQTVKCDLDASLSKIHADNMLITIEEMLLAKNSLHLRRNAVNCISGANKCSFWNRCWRPDAE